MKKRFVDNGDGTITDLETGLMWCEEDAPKTMDWDEANGYASSLTTEGYSDWRVPDRRELEELLDLKKYDPATKMPGIRPNYYWSSSPYAPFTSFAWIVSFNDGSVFPYFKDYNGYVRCVRNRQKGG